VIYWSGSQTTHATAVSIEQYLELREQKPYYRMGLSSRNLRAELAAGTDTLVRALIFLNEAFGLNMRPVLKDLETQYSAAFGDAAVHRQAGHDSRPELPT
jgi:hypothetical protein